MKKKLLFVLPSFGIGGTTVSTRNLISLLEKEGYECWAMPMQKRGVLCELYNNVNRLAAPFAVQALSYGGWKEAPTLPKKIVAIVLRGLCNISTTFEKHLVGNALDKVISGYGFDTIVACQESITSKFVSYVNHPNKVAWVRCDYNRIFEKNNHQKENFYQHFKAVVCVAEETCKHFKTIYPEYKGKTYCIPNPQDSDFLIRRAEQTENEPHFINDKFTIVSVGRLDPIKRFGHIAPIAKQLLERGQNFRWYIIGDGPEKIEIEQSIKRYGVEDCVVMLGAKTNPHYYIKNADLYVCLSLSEACPRVINEAKVLHTPVVSTDFDTAKEFIATEENGLICPIESIADGILRMMTDNNLRERVLDNINKFSFDNTDIINQIENIL